MVLSFEHLIPPFSKAMEKSKGLGCKLVPESYIQQGVNSLVSSDNLLSHLLEQRRLPERGWSDLQIERCLAEIALMDSNNFTGNYYKVKFN